MHVGGVIVRLQPIQFEAELMGFGADSLSLSLGEAAHL